MSKYKIVFEDVFDFSTIEKERDFTPEVVQKITKDIETKRIVISEKFKSIHKTLIVKSLTPIN